MVWIGDHYSLLKNIVLMMLQPANHLSVTLLPECVGRLQSLSHPQAVFGTRAAGCMWHADGACRPGTSQPPRRSLTHRNSPTMFVQRYVPLPRPPPPQLPAPPRLPSRLPSGPSRLPSRLPSPPPLGTLPSPRGLFVCSCLFWLRCKQIAKELSLPMTEHSYEDVFLQIAAHTTHAHLTQVRPHLRSNSTQPHHWQARVCGTRTDPCRRTSGPARVWMPRVARLSRAAATREERRS
jgi:hypothetical protein